MKRAFLRELCAAVGRETIATPFSQQAAGKLWDVATNGHAIAMLATTEPAFPARKDAPDVNRVIPNYIDQPRSVVLADLRDWAAGTDRCESCEGDGWTEDDQGMSVRCGCDMGFKNGLAELCGITVNRRLAWRFLRAMPQPEHVYIRNDGPCAPVQIAPADDSWRVYVMPVRLLGDEKRELGEAFP